MTNDITELLDISDDDSEVIDFHTDSNIKYVTVKKKPKEQYCPCCHSKLYSKGIFKRHPNNQVLQDGYMLDLTLLGRRWKCSNPDCNYTASDEFPFLESRKRTTKIIPILIIKELKDLNKSCAQVAREFHVSDTYVHQIFMQYVDMPRKKLTQIISIDEVFLNISEECKYALVIMDFVTGDILDVLPSRREKYTSSYFLSIPMAERDAVQFQISDMYNPYIKYTNRYFRNAKPICDSFHVLQWLLVLIGRYINDVKKRYQERDRKALEAKNQNSNKFIEKEADSDEVFILKKAKWVLLENQDNVTYIGPHYVYKLGRTVDTYQWEDLFLNLDSNFRRIKFLKDVYETFNNEYINDPDKAAARLDELIDMYQRCDLSIFRSFANLLKSYREPIINSFVYITAEEVEQSRKSIRRLSNGPIESYNNKPSGFRSDSHGLSNFSFVRNRLLWSAREDAAILAVPKSASEVHNYTGIKRGSYNK